MNLKKSEIENLAETARNFYQKGWTPATSGNLSFLVSRNPFRLAITPSRVSKSSLRPDQIIIVDEKGRKIHGNGNPSDELKLHLAIYQGKTEANSVLHTHSICNTLISDFFFKKGKVKLKGYEIIKVLNRNYSHKSQALIPILENSQDYDQLSKKFIELLKKNSDIHGILLKQHGLYTWGENLDDAVHHVEALEFLFETLMRQSELK